MKIVLIGIAVWATILLIANKVCPKIPPLHYKYTVKKCRCGGPTQTFVDPDYMTPWFCCGWCRTRLQCVNEEEIEGEGEDIVVDEQEIAWPF